MLPISVETRLSGTPRTRFLLELFGNSLQFPIANILLEMLLEGPAQYLFVPDLYTILFSGLVQAWVLSRWEDGPQPRRFLGNLIGPALYTGIETALEGLKFFEAPHHLAYWGFALAIGILQSWRGRSKCFPNAVAVVLENVVRAGILLAMYVLFELITNPKYIGPGAFFGDASHRFVALANLLLGLSLGLSSLTGQRHLALLKQTSEHLKTYSEWLLGRDLLARLIADPHALTLTRRERAILFADIRGFTRWSETRPPEEIVALINRYYDVAENTLNQFSVVKYKFSADEIMAVFPDAAGAAAAAFQLRAALATLLGEHRLGAGIGIHCGTLVEGLLGGGGVKFYDVIGDTVNTAKRIESAAQSGEILISQVAATTLEATTRRGVSREIEAKGKEARLTVFPLE